MSMRLIGICGVLGIQMQELKSREIETENGVSWKRICMRRHRQWWRRRIGCQGLGWYYVVLSVFGVERKGLAVSMDCYVWV